MLAIILLILSLAFFAVVLLRGIGELRDDPAATKGALILFFGVCLVVWIGGGLLVRALAGG